MHKRIYVLLAFIALVPAAGTLTVLAATDSKAPDPADSQLPKCMSIMVAADGPEMTLASLRDSAAVVSLVSVERIEPARWSTLDGKRPDLAGLRETTPVIVQPITLTVTEVLAGDIGKGSIEGYILGGTVGCDVMSVETPVEATLGEHVMLSLDPSAGISSMAGDIGVSRLWPIQNGLIATDDFGKVTVESLRQSLERTVP